MAQIGPMVKEFLSSRRIAVVGVSDRRDTGCNLAYRKFKQNGYAVSAVNPRINTFEGDPCYKDLKSIPQKPEAVFILANPAVTEKIVQECVDLGIKRVWMHCVLGTRPGLAARGTSVSQTAVELCKRNGIAVIPGSCPNQFLKPDFGHAMMRVMFGAFGLQRVD